MFQKSAIYIFHHFLLHILHILDLLFNLYDWEKARFYYVKKNIFQFYTTVAAVLVIIIQLHITSNDLLSYDDYVIDKS